LKSDVEKEKEILVCEVKRKLLVGSYGIPLEEFFCVPVEEWFN
jgi:hypothetical protein